MVLRGFEGDQKKRKDLQVLVVVAVGEKVPRMVEEKRVHTFPVSCTECVVKRSNSYQLHRSLLFVK